MTDDHQPIQVLAPDGTWHPESLPEEYRSYLDALTEDDLRTFHRDMRLTRAVDVESAALQRQGQLALWIPSTGQEAAQVGSGRAAKKQDFIFPAYREHAVAMIRGVDPVQILALLRGVTNGGWNGFEHRFHIYTLVIGSQALHATGYAMGVAFDGKTNTGDPETDEAVLVYFGDGATSQGDVSEAFVFAASYQTPQVFFLQNNHWAISVPVGTQSRVPLYKRSEGFGIPGVQVDGNDVLATYAVTAKNLDDARSGRGPRFIEALTYRMGAHTSSDDPSKYEDPALHAAWAAKDPITRFEAHLRNLGADEAYFDGITAEAKDLAADLRARALALVAPAAESMFTHVYAGEHPLMVEQQERLLRYEASFGESA